MCGGEADANQTTTHCILWLVLSSAVTEEYYLHQEDCLIMLSTSKKSQPSSSLEYHLQVG